jgi:hypothetical protein
MPAMAEYLRISDQNHIALKRDLILVKTAWSPAESPQEMRSQATGNELLPRACLWLGSSSFEPDKADEAEGSY